MFPPSPKPLPPPATLEPTVTSTIFQSPTLKPSRTPEPSPTKEPTPVFSINLTHNPESTTDLSGQIRQENLSQDLGHLADQMLTQAETLGIDYLNVPILAFGQQWNSDSDPNWAFFSWTYDEKISLADISNVDDRITNERHVVLTRLTAEGQPIGYVASILVRADPILKDYGLPGADQLRVAHFVVLESLVSQLEEARQKSQSILDPIDTVDEQLSENLARLTSENDLGVGQNCISFVAIGPEDPSKPDLVPDAYEDRIYINIDEFGSGLTDPATKLEMLKKMYDHLEERYFLVWSLKTTHISP